MSIEWLLFVILVVTTLINQGVQLYIHFEAYPVMGSVGKAEFAAYIQQYEKRLLVPLMLPFVIGGLANIALIFVRPEIVPVIGVILVLIPNLLVGVVTFTVAAPPYARILQAGEAKGADMVALMRVNLLRLALTTLSSGVLMVILYLILAGIVR